MEAHPIHLSQRIGSLDFLRGIAILGILFINIEVFCYPDPWDPYKYGFRNHSDEWARFWVYFLTQGKCYSMLAALFSVGFYIFIERLEKKGLGSRAFDIYGRRLLWLFMFGVCHAYLVWDGDILHHYAICGMLIFPFRAFKSKTLLILLLIPVSIQLLNAYLSTESTKDAYQNYLQVKIKNQDARSPDDLKKIANWEDKTKKGLADTSTGEVVRKSYFENIKENTKHIKIHTGRIFNQGILFRTIIMMILGILLYRSGIFVNYKSIRFYWPLSIGVLLIALGVNYARYYHWTFENYMPVTNFWQEWLYTFPKELLGLAYLLLFNGIYQKFIKPTGLKLISNIGRTALSNYILQNLLCGFIFYGYGLGMYNQFSRTELLAIVVAIWLLQICLTWLWLKKFKYGPLEWLWRKLTYGQLD